MGGHAGIAVGRGVDAVVPTIDEGLGPFERAMRHATAPVTRLGFAKMGSTCYSGGGFEERDRRMSQFGTSLSTRSGADRRWLRRLAGCV